jgi:hypothetical protein
MNKNKVRPPARTVQGIPYYDLLVNQKQAYALHATNPHEDVAVYYERIRDVTKKFLEHLDILEAANVGITRNFFDNSHSVGILVQIYGVNIEKWED